MTDRPLSPHLQIYRPMLTMMMSIVHRLTGMALYAGTLVFAWWLLAAAAGPGAYSDFAAVAGSIPGLVVLFGFTWALIHHLLGGVRHFVWDMGHGFGLDTIEWMARATIAGSVLITIILWIIGLSI